MACRNMVGAVLIRLASTTTPISGPAASHTALTHFRTGLLPSVDLGGFAGIPSFRSATFLTGDFPTAYMAIAAFPVKGFGKSMRGVRMMGGGPRTFPGGVTKWQWKRMQEKKERQLERARLMRERQAFEERQRQELMATSPRSEKPWERPLPKNPLHPSAAARDPRVRALADRFRKYGGEDLWSHEDGPEESPAVASVVSARFLPSKFSSSIHVGEEGTLNGSAGRSTGSFLPKSPGSSIFDESTSLQPNITFSQFSPQHARRDFSESSGEYQRRAVRAFSASSEAVLADELADSTAVGAAWQSIPPRDLHSEIHRPALRRQSTQRNPMDSAVISKRSAGSVLSQVEDVSRNEPLVKKLRPEVSMGKGTVAEDSSPSHLSDTRFDQFPISSLSVKALHEVMGYQKMTKVQEATFPVILTGKDVLAKAKTGTGKTIAFLLPSIETIIKSSSDKNLVTPRSPINILIICPTRELANQAASECNSLMTYHKKLGAQVVIGGTNMTTETRQLQQKPCQVLVATPGRLLDHLQTSKEVYQQLSHLKVLVLDEADRLLDMGFRKSLDAILNMLPTSRQTLLFSATVPNEVHKVSQIALKKDHVFIDTVDKNEEDTHKKVQQQYVIAPLERQLTVTYSLLRQHIEEEPNYKVLVFCTTARITAFMAELSSSLGLHTLEIHSRKSQGYRTRISDEFRKSGGGVIMFTSDVSARGVDYPDVTLVIQLGIPSGREDYIHRLGRTGRAGKDGQGILILAPWEKHFVKSLTDISITECELSQPTASIESRVETALAAVSTETKERAYGAWLGYYNTAKLLSLDKKELVRLANIYSSTLGMSEPPILMKRTIAMMGLKGVPGLRS